MNRYELRFIDEVFADTDDVRGELIDTFGTYEDAARAKLELIRLGIYSDLDLVISESF